MKILVDEICWDVPEGTDITALPMMDVIDLAVEDNDWGQEEFWDALHEKMEELHGIPVCGLSYKLLHGTLQ